MKTTFLTLILLALFTSIGCQKPCTTTTFMVNSYTGDTLFTERTYAICGDTLNYYERRLKGDSTIISEGEVLNGKKEGIWKTNDWLKTISDFKNGVATKVEMFHKNGKLMQVELLGADSMYTVKSYYENGTLESEFLNTLDGYFVGHGVDYDTLGLKASEGEYIAEPCLTDTMYIESSEPPYNLQMTIIEELGGKHGPWIYYDIEGNVTDTVVFDQGISGIEGRF